MKKLSTIKPKMKELEAAFDGNLDLVLFFLSWVKNSRNATKAYLELNPHVDPASAAVLGCRLLKKVKVEAVLQAYDLGPETYYQQLKEGLQASKWNDFTGEREADHKTRQSYHDKLGKLLEIEEQPAIVATQHNTQFNFFAVDEEKRKEWNDHFCDFLKSYYSQKEEKNLSP